ncbi:hypothetical protein DFQ28_009287 [Apophysomyces sp. BC1034]|nr:hypothetical protein DFQ28_009287 [Apophysomyces sp. BC1034]
MSYWTWSDQVHLYYRFKEKAKSTPDRVFVYFENKQYTFRQLEKASNRLAHWLLSQHVKKTDIVCMMLQNHPTFYVLLLAILKIGAVPALINTNLSDDSLLHCIKIANARTFIFDPVYEQQVSTVNTALDDLGISLYAYGEATEDHDLPPLGIAPTITPSFLASYSDKDTSEEYIKGITISDPAMLIYTSGTTGMPKAAISQHARVSMGMMMFSGVATVKPDDRVYCVLPLYHSSGIIVSTLVTLQAGGSIVLGRKFSARRFWDDCVQHQVTVFTYIGEFCRYLLGQPTHPQERNHRVRLVYGNGMRPDVWNRFRDRFGIPQICEFYAATEGDFGAGAVGHRGYIFRAMRPELRLIKIDPVTEEPLRTKNGLCVECKFGEQGELVVFMDKESPLQFSGYYKNKSATQKKIMTDVLEKGDAYFRSGDLLKLDQDGFYFFGDRVGDTFRWKSENVATTEVAQVIGVYPGIAEANVYGTLVPHHDGRAGMAAIVLQQGTKIDFKALYQYLRKKLPRYAIPIFVRFVPAMELTGTFKHQKVEFRNQGINLSKIPDTVYWLRGETYEQFTPEDYARLEAGGIKL